MSSSKRGAVAAPSEASDLRPSVTITDMDTVHEENDNDRYGLTKTSRVVYENTALLHSKGCGNALEYFMLIIMIMMLIIMQKNKMHIFNNISSHSPIRYPLFIL